MDCLHMCLNTQSCTSIAYYKDSADCVLNQHCNETTYSNNATSVITVKCLAGMQFIVFFFMSYFGQVSEIHVLFGRTVLTLSCH